VNRRGKTVAIVQARMGSTRLPGKCLADISGRPMIAHVLERARAARRIDELWLATSARPENDALAAAAGALGVSVFRGDEDDVLSRYAEVARRSGAAAIVRLTADCPMLDPEVIDACIARFHDGAADYVSNAEQRSFPDGLDVEVFTAAALFEAEREARDPFLRLHVTPYIRGKGAVPKTAFVRDHLVNGADFSHLRWTVDEPADLDLVRRLIARLPQGYRWQDAVALMTAEPALLRRNRQHGLNEGAARDRKRLAGAPAARRFDASNALFARALETVPLASQTFSKSHQQWVRGATPLFLVRGEGGRVEDVDGNRFIDYVLGLLPIVLGYRDPDVDAAIADQLERGIVFSLASPLEHRLAERLRTLIPCAEMTRFGKNGSDATTAAIRLARAATGRDLVAVGGYHGWHDWYIGSTTRDLGVPGAVKALTRSFAFNDAASLEAVFAAAPGAVAAVILEPAGVTPPAPGFLEAVRELCTSHGAVLVFDEIVTGFRLAMGGAQARYGVVPDLACFGKSMANGMPIAAVVGRRDLMRRMEDIFFSGTFGGECLSLAAALATLDKLEKLDVPARLARRGERLIAGANAAFARHGLAAFARFGGEGWWPRLALGKAPVPGPILTSLLRQEFVAEGLLLGASFNLCLAHDDDAVEAETLAAMERALAAVGAALARPDPASALRGAPVQPTFSVRKTS
jgi:glutamate-1-semialdehyde 2,1-aminomutase